MGELRGARAGERTQSSCIVLGIIFVQIASNFVDTTPNQGRASKYQATSQNKSQSDLSELNQLSLNPHFLAVTSKETVVDWCGTP